ncbi:MAG: neutral/alkaline non-lysosomal ceramidase N-terminal domain-containing protein [Saprospiraceae bacterium]|nr:neutral/alkaline non-lysosomal ceramidase N-terminal domain-containing protein [Saprospiraceae bacterium]
MRRLFVFFLFILFVQSVSGQRVFQAGTARINITPETPIRMSGYGNRDNPFSGVHDSIYATALVFELDDQKIAMVSADVVGFSHDFVDETKIEIEKSTGIPADKIWIIATHNHGGPITSVYMHDPSETEKEYIKTLKSKLTATVQDAQHSLRAAKIGLGNTTCLMNINRRARHAEGGIWLGRNPAGPCDHEVSIIRIDDLQNQPIGAFINWPCHGTVSGQDNTQITGDWPGVTAHHFGTKTKTMVMVTAGASADINPIYGPNNKFNDIDAIGQILADESIQVFNHIKTSVPSSVSLEEAKLTASGKKRSDSRLPGITLEPGDDQVLRLSVLKIGSIVLAGISGELMTEIGMQIKKESPLKNTVIVTHCNGNNGYLCTDKAYEEGGYEPMVSKTMPGTAQQIINTINELLQKLM